MGLISKWWQRQHGRQLGITATLSGSIGILLCVSIYQLLFLQNHVSWGDFTGQSIGLAVFSSIALVIVLPEFLSLRGHVHTLDEIQSIESTSELRRRKEEGNEAADVLGAGHAVSWTAFLESKGLRR
ncbi:MAG: hypothetical protein ACI8T6_000535 [Candidatus Poseidoniaceae archaeon]|jgi:hypothetical protein